MGGVCTAKIIKGMGVKAHQKSIGQGDGGGKFKKYDLTSRRRICASLRLPHAITLKIKKYRVRKIKKQAFAE